MKEGGREGGFSIPDLDLQGERENVLERLAEGHGRLRHLHGYLCTGHRREDANIVPRL
jgi:hypothetical protein